MSIVFFTLAAIAAVAQTFGGPSCCSGGVAPQGDCTGLNQHDCEFHLPQCAWGPSKACTPLTFSDPNEISLVSAADFVESSGVPLPVGFASDASTTSNAPFGLALRSGGPHSIQTADAGVQLTPGVTVDSVAFSYRQMTGYATTVPPAPNFTLSVAGTVAFESVALTGYPYPPKSNPCAKGDCYSPAVQASASNLGIKVPSDGVQRVGFDFYNTGQNIQLLLPMTITLTCTGGPCTQPPPPPPAPNATATIIACVGDSITQGYLSSNGATYPHQLQTMLGSDYKVLNFGAGGRTMLKKGDNPYWTTGPLKAALASKPAIVVLMLGTNDAKFHNWGPLHDEFPIDYKSMIDDFKNVSTKPTIYLMVPPPLYQNGRYGMNQTVINSLFPGNGPAGVRTLAKASGLPEPIDLFSLFQGHCPVVGGTPGHAPNNTDVNCDWIASGGADACHPSNEGYGQLAKAVKARLAP